MTISLFLGILTLTPAIAGLIIAGLGMARQATRAPMLSVAVLGALVPAVCLLFLTPYVSSGEPLYVTLFGGSIAPNAWFSAAYRLDAFGMYGAIGVAFLIAPLLLWLGWRGATAPASEHAASWAQWGGVALVLGIETAALTVLFADNLLWLSFAWLVLVALIWGLGEVGSDLQTLDRTGLALMVAGPLAWAVVFLAPALGKANPQVIYPRITDMMGRGGMTWPQVVALALALALATGAYPFIVWVRRRAALITPAGLAALILMLVPVAIFVGARTYSAIEDASGLWPHQQQTAGSTAPPITAGVAFIVLGALTVGISGLLALGRNDARALLAYAVVAQGGWGLVALGVGEPDSVLGVPVLLATTVLGGGAAVAALFAGGTLTSDIEPEGAGPRAAGMPLRPLHLAAWTIGAISLVGAPLFGGFVSRQLVSAGALQAHGLPIPLVGIAWAGDILLALALLRATAPAFATAFGLPAPSSDATQEQPAASSIVRWLPELPAAIFAGLALVVGIAPQALLALGATRSAEGLLQPNFLAATLKVSLFGYSAGTASWLPSVAWLVIVPIGALLAFLLPTGTREARPLLLSGRHVEPTEATTEFEVASPSEAWSDLAPAFRSQLTLPGSKWLLNGTEDEQQDALDESTLDEESPDSEWTHEHAEVGASGQVEFSDGEGKAQYEDETEYSESLESASSRPGAHNGDGSYVGAQRGPKGAKGRKGNNNQRSRGGRS